jgi:hypothetical protein
MTNFLEVGIGLIIGISLIIASVWWSFRPPSNGRSILPDAHANTTDPTDTNVWGSGNDTL